MRKNTARDRCIASRVLQGYSIREVGSDTGISYERVRQIVTQVCREANPRVFARIGGEKSTYGVGTLRVHAEKFLNRLIWEGEALK